MSRSERDLVTALRDELAAIDPSRPCDRVAEADGLGPGPTGREASVARLAVRLRRAAETASATPFDWAIAGDHCRTAWLRGRFLARGSLSLASGRTHLEFVVRPDEAPILAARLADVGLPGVVARPARPWRGHLEERRGGRDLPAPDRGGRGAPRGRGAAGLARPAWRAQPGPQCRVGQPAAGRQRGRDASSTRSPSSTRTGGWPSSRRASGWWPMRAARRPRRASEISPSASGRTVRPSSARSSASSDSRSTMIAATRWHDSSHARGHRRRQLEDAHHPGRCRRARPHDRRTDPRRPASSGSSARRSPASPRSEPHLPTTIPTSAWAPRTSTTSSRARTPARSRRRCWWASPRWVIVGHSERRRDAGETDEQIGRKLRPRRRGGAAAHPVRRRAAGRARGRPAGGGRAIASSSAPSTT